MNVLSFDIEEWFEILDLPESLDNKKRIARHESRVERNTNRLLELLAVHGTKATFFMVGWLAEQHPELVKKIQAQGHEIGSHGYAHKLITQISPDEFRDDLVKGIHVLKNITGEKIRSFRGPGFSITPENQWAFKIIAECGIKYDSTVYPGKHGHGGHKNFTSQPVELALESIGKDLFEFPISVARILGKKMCFSGGGYFRILPYTMIRKKMREFQSAGKPVIVYLHPRDIDPDTPRLKMPIIRRFKSYVNINGTLAKLERLLKEFAFTRLDDFYTNHYVRSGQKRIVSVQ